jgi:hypothetical protein
MSSASRPSAPSGAIVRANQVQKGACAASGRSEDALGFLRIRAIEGILSVRALPIIDV